MFLKKLEKFGTFFPPNSLVVCVYISVWRPWVDFQTCRHPLLCAARKRVAERRGGAALWEDNVRRLSNRASMTLPPAGLLDYQPFAASLTSAGPFTMETPRLSPPTAPSSQNPSEVTHRLLLKLIWGQRPEPIVTIDPVPEGLTLLSVIVLLLRCCEWLTDADGSSVCRNEVGVTCYVQPQCLHTVSTGAISTQLLCFIIQQIIAMRVLIRKSKGSGSIKLVNSRFLHREIQIQAVI